MIGWGIILSAVMKLVSLAELSPECCADALGLELVGTGAGMYFAVDRAGFPASVEIRITEGGGLVLFDLHDSCDRAACAVKLSELGEPKDIDMVSPPMAGPGGRPAWERKYSVRHTLSGKPVWFGIEERKGEKLLVSIAVHFGAEDQDEGAIVDRAPRPVEEDTVRDCIRGFNRLGLTLAFGKDPDGNFLVSPLSIAFALSMLTPGAKGATRDEIADALGLDVDDVELGEVIGSLLTSLRSHQTTRLVEDDETGSFKSQKVDASTLRLANAVFANEDYPILEGARKLLAERFEAELRAIDFSQTAQAVRTINGWVAEKTCDRIRDLLHSSNVSDAARMILVNALYFQAEWEEPFEPELTTDKPFHLADGGAIDVPMMRQTMNLRYCRDDALGVEIVEIPYKAMGMLVLLPRREAPGGPDAVRPTVEDLDRIIGGLKYGMVDLQLPRFRVESRRELSADLQKLGVRTPFGNTADFSGFTSQPEGLLIDEIIHQTFINVDENGTEAAAATAIAMALAAAGEEPTPIPFVVDRPFLFFIRDDTTGCILFAGAVRDPGAP